MYVVKHEKRQNAWHWFTTKLGLCTDDISVEFGGHICQQPVLCKKNTLPMTYMDILGLCICTSHTKWYSQNL